MTKNTKIREIDLKPYQTHFLFQSDSLLTPKGIERLLKELPKFIDDSLEDEDDRCEILAEGPPREITKEEQIAWLAYSKRVNVRWAAGPDAPKDIEHHLVVLTARSSFLSVVATDKSLGAKLTRGGSGKEWKALHRVSFSRLERALVSGNKESRRHGPNHAFCSKPDSLTRLGKSTPTSRASLSK